MATSECFSLQWNDFNANMSAGFEELFARGDLVDVTLAADGQMVKAHKVVLSVCSPYFRDLFKSNPTEHPIVFLNNVSFKVLNSLLQFVYRGVVNIDQSEFQSFLSTADQLQIKSLVSYQAKPVTAQPLVLLKQQDSNTKTDQSDQSAAVSTPVKRSHQSPVESTKRQRTVAIESQRTEVKSDKDDNIIHHKETDVTEAAIKQNVEMEQDAPISVSDQCLLDNITDEWGSMNNPEENGVDKFEREMIIDLYKKLKLDNPELFQKDIVELLSEWTGVGSSTIRNTLMVYRRTGVIKAPNKTRFRTSMLNKISNKVRIDVRKKVYSFYYYRCLPTFLEIFDAVNKEESLPNFKRTTFHRLLKQLNFEYTKTRKYKIITERKELVYSRRKFLKDIDGYRRDGRTIYYLDETCICSDGKSKISNRKSNVTIFHIGSVNGFVRSGLECFESKKKLGDYLDDRNSKRFTAWFQSILPLLDENSVIVMDLAPGHCTKLELSDERFPNETWNKEDITTWLEDRGEVVDSTMLKMQLFQVVEKYRSKIGNYIVDDAASRTNRTVLRLPLFHGELNAFGLAWREIEDHILSFRMNNDIKDIESVISAAIEKVTPDRWKCFIQETIAEEDKFKLLDCLVQGLIDELPLSHIIDDTESDNDEESQTDSSD